MAGKNQHVLPHGTDWGVKGAGNQKYTGYYDTQAEATAAAKQIAIHQQSELITHGRNGQIRSKDSFGNDPNPAKDLEH